MVLRIPAIAALTTLVVATASAQQPAVLSDKVRAEVIDSVVTRLERTYVEADTARLIGAYLRQRLELGTYRSLDNPAQFADRVTRDLQSLNGDLHLSLRYTPSSAAPSPGGGPGDPRVINFGLGRAEILDGNIGYLEITAFAGAPGYQDAVVDALRFLSRTDAVIIDVRRNGGGSGEMSHFVFSHFLGAESVPTITVRRRAPAEPQQRRSLGEVPGPRRETVPLYVLTSQGTASAAEEFSFVLKNQKRATIVGSRTAGAGHMVTSIPVGHNFLLGASITRVSDPTTGKEWEGVGVIPDLAVEPERALLAAQAAALKAMLAGKPDPDRARTLGRLLASIDARQRPTRAEPGIAKFAGSYQGRVVSVLNGKLGYARRAGALTQELVPLGAGRFALGAVQFRFEVKDGATVLTIDQADGTQVTFPRDG